MFRLNDSMTTIPNETRLIVRLGRALKPGEFRIKLSLLRMKEVEVCVCLSVCVFLCEIGSGAQTRRDHVILVCLFVCVSLQHPPPPPPNFSSLPSAPQFFKPIMDSIVAKGMTVRTFKEQIVKEAYEQGIEHPLQLDR